MKRISQWLNKSSIRNTCAVIIILLSYAFLFKIASNEVPSVNQRLVDILGSLILGATLPAVVGWLYGSTKNESDRQKSDNPNKPE